VGAGLRIKRAPHEVASALRGTSLAMLFQKTSTRTRCSFEAAMREMGGNATYLDWNSTNFVLTDVSDEAEVLSRFYDFIVARVRSHETLHALHAGSRVPVINGLCDRHHPCQAIADLLTIAEYFGPALEGLRLAYLGDGNNVCRSLVEAAAALSVTVHMCSPCGYELEEATLQGGRHVVRVEDPADAVATADIVYTDSWVSIGQEDQTAVRRAAFAPYQVNARLMALAPAHALFMHCLPAHPGLEVTADVLRSSKSIVFEQAENRKHAQKALLLHLRGSVFDW